jgi:NADH:ubiquinone oxidoreductase subunit 3 (subunit A)
LVLSICHDSIFLIILLIYLTMVIIAIGTLVALMAFALGIKSLIDQEKSRPFECGFSPQSSARSPFSLHFFLIAILFIIFDVELVLLFPYFLCPSPPIEAGGVFALLLLLLRVGVFVEWAQKMLDWANLK